MFARRRRVIACRVGDDLRLGLVARDGIHGAAEIGSFARRKRGKKDFPLLCTGRALTGLGIFNACPCLVFCAYENRRYCDIVRQIAK